MLRPFTSAAKGNRSVSPFCPPANHIGMAGKAEMRAGAIRPAGHRDLSHSCRQRAGVGGGETQRFSTAFRLPAKPHSAPAILRVSPMGWRIRAWAPSSNNMAVPIGHFFFNNRWASLPRNNSLNRSLGAGLPSRHILDDHRTIGGGGGGNWETTGDGSLPD